MKKLTLSLFLIFSLSTNAAGIASPLALSAEDLEEAKTLHELKVRREMLTWHRYAAWTTVALMAATFATAPGGEHEHGAFHGGTHRALGILSGVGYLTSASLALAAPRPQGTPQDDNIIVHKKLAYIHVPAFLLTIAAGLTAYKQREDGKKASGLGAMHSKFVAITALSFGAAAFMSTDWGLQILPASKKDIACVLTKNF